MTTMAAIVDIQVCMCVRAGAHEALLTHTLSSPARPTGRFPFHTLRSFINNNFD